MATPQTLETSADHKLSVTVADKKQEKVKRVKLAQWIRAATLGATDGLLSTSSLMLGVGAVKEDQWSMILSGLAGSLAGAFSMAVGEFVSVSTQRDIERAVIEQCSTKAKLNEENNIKLEISSCPSPAIIENKPIEAIVSSPLMKVILRDERMHTLKVSEEDGDKGEALPNPYKAAAASSAAFLCGSLVPLVSAICVTEHTARIVVIVVVTSIALALFGGIGAQIGGLPLRLSAARVLFGGWVSMAITYSLLKPFNRVDRGHNTN